MAAHSFFLSLILILVGARLCGEIAIRLGAPAVIGELTAGVLMGPSALGWLEVTPVLHLLAELGILMLLFQAGLETDVTRLARAGPKAAVVAIGGFLGPFLLGFGLSRVVFELPLLASLLIGGTLTATSIGVTVRVLRDIGRQRSAEGQIIMGAAVLDDVMGVILLAILFDFARDGQINAGEALRVILFMGAFFLLAPIIAKLMSRFIHRFNVNSQIPGMIPTAVVSLVLVFAFLAHSIGAPELLGGFAAGLALSRRFFLPFGLAMARDSHFASKVDEETAPIVHLVTPVFFVVVGASLDLTAVDWGSGWFWAFSLTLAVLAIAGKFVGALLIAEPLSRRIAIGMSMVPRGEVGLVFAETGRATGMISNDVYAVLLIVIVYTTVFSPFWIKLYYRRFANPCP